MSNEDPKLTALVVVHPIGFVSPKESQDSNLSILSYAYSSANSLLTTNIFLFYSRLLYTWQPKNARGLKIQADYVCIEGIAHISFVFWIMGELGTYFGFDTY
jgi:hypothetical protein